MKAAIIKAYGTHENISIQKGIKTPDIRSDEVLVKMKATALNPMDITTRKGGYRFLSPFTDKRKRPLTGLEFSGSITGLGDNVNEFFIGQEVYGYIDLLKGYPTHAEYIPINKNHIAQKPATVSHAEAASLPVGMITAIRALKDIAGISPGKQVLIIGASGGVGVYAVQYANAAGALVTAVTGTNSLDFVQSLGAASVVDYQTRDIRDINQRFDIIFDVANVSRFSVCKPLLKTNGIFITTDPFKDIAGYAKAFFSAKKSGYLMVLKGRTSDFEYAARLVDQGQIRPVIEKVFPFSKISDAHEYFETHKRKGKVILEMDIPNTHNL